MAYRTLTQLGFDEVYNMTGGYKTYEYATMSPDEFKPIVIDPRVKILKQSLGRPGDDISGQKELKSIDACGLSCPGPLNSLITGIGDLPDGHFLQIKATDASFASSVKAYCELNDGVDLISMKKRDSALIVIVHKKKSFDAEKKTIDVMEEVPEEKPVRPVGLPVVSEISAKDLYDEIHSDNPPAIIIDVREKGEFKQGHLKDAVLIPLGQLQRRIPELEQYKKSEIITICHSGSRSFMAGRFLERAGFEFIRSARGGMISWVRSKYKYVR